MCLESTRLSEISQTEKDKYVLSHLHVKSKKIRPLETESSLVINKGCQLSQQKEVKISDGQVFWLE